MHISLNSIQRHSAMKCEKMTVICLASRAGYVIRNCCHTNLSNQNHIMSLLHLAKNASMQFIGISVPSLIFNHLQPTKWPKNHGHSYKSFFLFSLRTNIAFSFTHSSKNASSLHMQVTLSCMYVQKL